MEVPPNGKSGLLAQLYNKTLNQWNDPVTGQVENTARNTITSPGITFFGPYTLVYAKSPLQVELVRFDVKLNDKEEADISDNSQ